MNDDGESLRLATPNGHRPLRGRREPRDRVVELTFDEGILVTCGGCGLSWRVEDRPEAADWWRCPGGTPHVPRVEIGTAITAPSGPT